MLDSNFDFVWTFTGNDVFCPMENNLKPIELCSDRIIIYDFNNVRYELNYAGELISKRKGSARE